MFLFIYFLFSFNLCDNFNYDKELIENHTFDLIIKKLLEMFGSVSFYFSYQLLSLPTVKWTRTINNLRSLG